MMEDEVEFMPLFSINEDEDAEVVENVSELPVIAMRNTVLFPGVVLPITVGRAKSIQAIKEAQKTNSLIGVVAQIDSKIEDPKEEELYTIGTLARIVKVLKMPDGINTVIIQGKKRFKVNKYLKLDPFLKAEVSMLEDIEPKKDKEFNALIESIKDVSAKIIKLSPNIPVEANIMLRNISKPSFLMHFVASNMNVDLKEKQRILELNDLRERAMATYEQLGGELQMAKLKDQIQSKVKTDIEKQQRDYLLNQQLKQIQEELGGDSPDKELQNLVLRSKKMEWDKSVAKAFDKEIQKLKRINPAAAEYSIQLNYLEFILEMPWAKVTQDSFDLTRARKVLDKDHYGLSKVKDRILEYLAVLKLKGDLKSPILCFVGPPGVGKTSLGKSIARALDRNYVRMSLGGLHDEAEIRGHRKTYIGAMPGRIIQSIKKAGSSNPLFILDEIDKVGKDFRGDPSSALLEVLDPEQNSSFHDNYLDIEYDLSKVMFIATANSLSTIQPALRDRMEIIEVSGYSLEEKVEIANQHLIPKQRKAHGLKASHVKLNKKVLRNVVANYTRESGVRELDRQIASVMRSIAKQVAMEEKYNLNVAESDLENYLGKPRYEKDLFLEDNPAGVAIGLAWTQVGGEILFIECSLSPGKGELQLTGNLGDVMKESASTALSFVKSNAKAFKVEPEVFEKTNIHIHIPEGAIPKDGPSAGITMLSALVSSLTNKKLKKNIAMTGEITLRGRVLPVGGIKEKILAAKRAGIKEIILCSSNRKDVDEIDTNFLKGMKFKYVSNMMDVIKIALEK